MNPKKYGKLLGSHIEDGKIIYYIQITPLSLAKIKYTDLDKNEVEIIKDGMTVIKYTDYWIDENKFKRVIGENKEATFYFTRTGEFELFTIWKPSRFIKRKRQSSKLDKKVVTLDIETYLNNDQEHIPYLIAYFDGDQSHSFYLSEYESPNAMIKACISSLLIPKYNNHKVYIHNMANFDSIFLLKNLVGLGDVKVLINKGKLIMIDLIKNIDDKQQIEISFRDSYQIY